MNRVDSSKKLLSSFLCKNIKTYIFVFNTELEHYNEQILFSTIGINGLFRVTAFILDWNTNNLECELTY
jgi:hypothetical protein